MVDLEQIDAFLAVVREGQFTRAATRTGLSQPALSRRIDALERDLGVTLFERGPRGAWLTAAGAALLPHAERLVAAAGDGRRAVREAGEGDTGPVTIALVGTLASTSLPDMLRRFRARHPGITLRLRTARSDEVGDLVRQGEADIGVRYFPDPSMALVSRVIGQEAVVVVAAPDHELAGAATIAPPRLGGRTWVTYPIGSGSSGEPFARLLRDALARAGIPPGEIVEIDSLTAQKRLVEAGFGLGLVPRSAIVEEHRVGSLVVLDVPDISPGAPIVTLRRRDGYLGRAAERLLAMLAGNEG